MKGSAKKNKKLWSGRFKEEAAALLEEFSASINFDKRLYKYDIRGSIAHSKMLAKTGIISQKESKALVRELKNIEKEIEEGELFLDPKLEDIHMNIESQLIKRLGDVGAKLHTARSRNDQIALDIRMYLKDTIEELIALLSKFQQSLLGFAEKNKATIFPGFTHLQHAQPILLGHHILAYIEMFERDKQRLCDTFKRVDVMPLGACALAGTALPIDREYVARELGFSEIAHNSIDAVSDRDFAIEYLSDLAILGMHFSRLSEELILWSSEEFNYVEIAETFCTGSSMLPQKKNPDVPELTRGRTGHLFGNLLSLLTTMKGLPLSYNRDMQEDKEPIFQSTDIIKGILQIFIEMIKTIKVNSSSIASKLQRSSLQAADLAEYLVQKGVSFRKSHNIVGKIFAYANQKNIKLKDLTIAELKRYSDRFENDAIRLLDPWISIKQKISAGSTSPKMVQEQLKKWKSKLSKQD